MVQFVLSRPSGKIQYNPLFFRQFSGKIQAKFTVRFVLGPILGDVFSGGSPYASYADYPVNTYGYLYNINAAVIVCPAGWHLPTQDDWVKLIQYVDSKEEYRCDGKIAKALASRVGWATSTVDCAVGNDPTSNNATGFSVLPAGVNSINLADSQFELPMISLSPRSLSAGFWYCDIVSMLLPAVGNVLFAYDNPSYGLLMPYNVNDANLQHHSVRCVKNY